VYLTVEVALLISGMSVAFGIFAGISNLRRNQKLDRAPPTTTTLYP